VYFQYALLRDGVLCFISNRSVQTIKKNTDLPPRPPTGESVSGSESGAVIAHGRRAGQASPRVQSPNLDESTSRTRGPL